MQTEKLKILQDMPIFGGVRDHVLDFLVSKAQTTSVPKGSFFFREGDQADAIYILEKGKVIIVKNWQGCAYELGSLTDGDCFGEMALIDMSSRSASVKAVENSQSMKLTADHLYELYKADLSQFAIIQMNIAREISRRLREADQRLFLTKVAQQSNDQETTYYTFRSG